jgi:acetyltransferase-like isoleucine patch superfamily enzyme
MNSADRTDNPSIVREMEHHRKNVIAGRSCIISSFCSLENVTMGNDVVIGDGTQLKNVVIGNNTKVGRRVTIYSPESDCPVQIGSHCWFSYGVLAEATGGKISVGECSVIAHYSLLLTSSGPGPRSPAMEAILPSKLGDVRVGASSWIGAHCTLLPGVLFEEGVVLAANSMASAGRYESWRIYGGCPARFIRKLDPTQLKRPDIRIDPRQQNSGLT